MSDHQIQQGASPQKQPNAASPSIPFQVVVNNDAKDIKKAEVARNINTAKHPVIVIAEKQASHYGEQAQDFHDAFRNCAIVFESVTAEKNFYAANPSMAFYIHHQTVGILDKTAKDKDDHHPVFTESDHIIVMGDMYGFNEDEFKAMAKNGQTVTFSNNMDTPVDLQKIAAMRDKPRDFKSFAFRYRIGMP
jgi:hypothetical protein